MNLVIGYLLGILTAVENSKKPYRSMSGDRKSLDQREPTAPQRRDQTQETKWWPSTFKEWVDILGVTILILYTITTIGLWYSARDANRQTRELMQSQNRPWLGISTDKPINIEKFEIIPNTVQPNGGQPMSMHVEVSYWLDNSGGSPARRISPAALLAVPTSEGNVPEQWQKMNCNLAEQISRGGTVPTIIIMPRSQAQQRSESSGEVPPNVEFHHVWLLGCIAYQDTWGGPIHHTRVVLHSPYTPSGMRFSFWDSEAD
jgi:hypothetical protein